MLRKVVCVLCFGFQPRREERLPSRDFFISVLIEGVGQSYGQRDHEGDKAGKRNVHRKLSVRSEPPTLSLSITPQLEIRNLKKERFSPTQ